MYHFGNARVVHNIDPARAIVHAAHTSRKRCKLGLAPLPQVGQLKTNLRTGRLKRCAQGSFAGREVDFAHFGR